MKKEFIVAVLVGAGVVTLCSCTKGKSIQGTLQETTTEAVSGTPTMAPTVEPTVEPTIEPTERKDGVVIDRDIIDFVKEQARDIDYDTLASDPDFYKDRALKIRGTVVKGGGYVSSQILFCVRMEGSGGKSSSNDIWVAIPESCIEKNISEDDELLIYGTGAGEYEYRSYAGDTRTLPIIYGYTYEIMN